MTIASWLAAAIEDAERRGLPDLKPLLETLARATERLRQADAALQTSPGPQSPDDPKR